MFTKFFCFKVAVGVLMVLLQDDVMVRLSCVLYHSKNSRFGVSCNLQCPARVCVDAIHCALKSKALYKYLAHAYQSFGLPRAMVETAFVRLTNLWFVLSFASLSPALLFVSAR